MVGEWNRRGPGLARGGQEGDERQKTGAEKDEIANPDSYRLLRARADQRRRVAARGSSSSAAMNW